MRIVVRSVARDERERVGLALGVLEHAVRYPLGRDSFRIDHGADYFAFFDRLGESNVWVAEDSAANEVVGGLVAVRRPEAGSMPDCWYLCDLKVSGWHGFSVGRLLLRSFAESVGRLAAGYGVSMNPPDSRPNPLIRFVRRMLPVPIETATLHLYSLSYRELLGLESRIVAERGGCRCRDLRSVKAIVLASTGQPMPLLHVEFSVADGEGDQRNLEAPTDGHVHMLCTPAGDALDRVVTATGATPSATATVLSHAMTGVDWRWIVSSEI